ncbi:MAG: proton-conducting transporter membrane subunit [Patescibacteria group bacterium]
MREFVDISMGLLTELLVITGCAAPCVAGFVVLLAPHRNTVMQSVLVLGSLAGFCGTILSFFIENPIFALLAPYTMVDAVSLFFLLLVFAGTGITSFFAIAYVPLYKYAFPASRVNGATAFFVTGMLGVVVAGSVPLFLFFWEVMSIAAYFLVVSDRSAESIKAGLIYFVMTHLGLVSLLGGFALIAPDSIFATWQDVVIAAGGASYWSLAFAFALFCIGFGSKAGIVPFHAWLPYAHPQAPSHSSALLSGVMLPVAVFGFIRISSLFPFIPFEWACMVIAAGLLSAFFGSLHAAVEKDMKRLLAYSSIEHMGLIFTGIGVLLVLKTAPHEIAGPLIEGVSLFIALHLVNHMFFKAGLFMSAGIVAAKTHTRNLDELGGLAKRWPLFSGGVLLLSLSAAALPPLGTFFGEWALMQSLALGIAQLPLLFAGVLSIVLMVVALAAGLALLASIKLFSVAFLGRARTEKAAHVESLPWSLMLAPLFCAVGGVLTAFIAVPFFAAHTMRGANIVFSDISLAPTASVNVWATAATVLVLAGLILLVRRLFGAEKVRITATWDCGAPLTPRMQYTATGFAGPVRFFFRPFLFLKKTLTVTPLAGHSWIASRVLISEVGSVWERWVYQPVADSVLSVASYAARIQSGIVQVYILIIFVTLVATLTLAI